MEQLFVLNKENPVHILHSKRPCIKIIRVIYSNRENWVDEISATNINVKISLPGKSNTESFTLGEFVTNQHKSPVLDTNVLINWTSDFSNESLYSIEICAENIDYGDRNGLSIIYEL